MWIYLLPARAALIMCYRDKSLLTAANELIYRNIDLGRGSLPKYRRYFKRH